MTDAPLGSVNSPDGKTWSAFKNIVNGYSDYGLAMTVYRGELWGIMTQTVQYPGTMFINKYNPTSGWNSSWVTLSEFAKAVGRVSITTLNDRIYLVHRAPSDNGVYLGYYDGKAWDEVGRVGSTTATSYQSPAIAAYQGKLYIAYVAKDNTVWWCSRDGNGKPLTDWVKIGGLSTDDGLELCVHKSNLYLFHKGGSAFYVQTFTNGGWSAATKVGANVETGIGAASLADGTMIASYRGPIFSIAYSIFTEGSGWGKQQYVPGFMVSQPGAASFNGLTLISYAKPAWATKVGGYADQPMIMDEKAANAQVDDVDQEWECKWDQSGSSDCQKTWIQKMFCM